MNNSEITKDNANIYLLFQGNSKDGKLMFVTTSKSRMREAVVTMMHDGSVSEYRNENGDPILSATDRIRQFRQDWKYLSRLELNDRMTGAYLGATANGVFL